MSRPEKITYELIIKICEDIARGYFYDQAALNNGISASTFFRWMRKGKEPDAEQIYKVQKFLTWEEVSQTYFGKFDSHIKFLALHGLRWGEAVALRESDIYDDKVHINKSMYGPTKTASGVREVP
jgi:integrase